MYRKSAAEYLVSTERGWDVSWRIRHDASWLAIQNHYSFLCGCCTWLESTRLDWKTCRRYNMYLTAVNSFFSFCDIFKSEKKKRILNCWSISFIITWIELITTFLFIMFLHFHFSVPINCVSVLQINTKLCWEFLPVNSLTVKGTNLHLLIRRSHTLMEEALTCALFFRSFLCWTWPEQVENKLFLFG